MLKGFTVQLRRPLLPCLLSFFCCYLLGLVLFFPVELIISKTAQQAEQQGLEVQIHAPEILFPPGLGIAQLTLQHPGFPHPPLELTEVELKPIWTSLFGLNPGIAYDLQVFSGTVQGNAFRNGAVEAKLGGLKINQQLGPQLPLQISGDLVDGEFYGNLPLQGKNPSKLSLTLDNLLISGMERIGSGNDQLQINSIYCEVRGSGSQFKITELTATGPALNLDATGTIRLGPSPQRSPVNLNLTITPQPALDPVLADLLSVLKKPQPDGSYQLRLFGTLANVRFK